jgi:hypothetical protein
MKATLVHTTWYHSPQAAKVRTIINGGKYAFVMVVALFTALFMPDLWILSGVDSNVEVDVSLTIVMVLFTLELIMLSAVDAAYFMSFFFFMDIVGTVSMLFDITWFFGSPHDEPQAMGDADAKKNLMLLRASRAAKVGARAGRLSRVLRILRFIPLLGGSEVKQEEKETTGIAKNISAQLGGLIATRVACLTIVLVMIIPLFDIWTFPQHDYSLETWADRLSSNLRKGLVDETIAEQKLMVDFYDRYPYYGPFRVCTGAPTNDAEIFRCEPCNLPTSVNGCQEILDAWRPAAGSPPRGASTFIVHTEIYMIAFNMHQPCQLEAGLSICTIWFIIFIMVFSGLALTSVVNQLAVRPIERMLGTVRDIASTVFKFSAEAMEEDSLEEDMDISQSNEMKLLEKVVQKLATIADLTSKKPQATEDMGEEDIGILSMMQGRNIAADSSNLERDRMSCAVMAKKRTDFGVSLDSCGLSQEQYDSLKVNILSMAKPQLCKLVQFIIPQYECQGTGFVSDGEDQSLLEGFITAIEQGYSASVPFHSFFHAVDVLHGVARETRLMETEAWMTDLERFSLLIAAISHDLGHPGVNNGFLSEVGHELALQYNDSSVLENMHCSKLYEIVGKPETNIFSRLTREQYKESRKLCIETILHTDMMNHGAMVKEMQLILQMNSEAFSADSEDNRTNPAVLEVFAQVETKMLVMECVLHCADISNPCRIWDVTRAWADVCLEEYFAQGDQEKMLGIPVQFLNDREKLNRPSSQIGFIEFMVAPLMACVVRLWPPLKDFTENLSDNTGVWESMWVKEVNPTEEEKAKVNGRVKRVQAMLQDAKERAPSKI